MLDSQKLSLHECCIGAVLDPQRLPNDGAISCFNVSPRLGQDVQLKVQVVFGFVVIERSKMWALC
jgi:hypothetical protein